MNSNIKVQWTPEVYVHPIKKETLSDKYERLLNNIGLPYKKIKDGKRYRFIFKCYVCYKIVNRQCRSKLLLYTCKTCTQENAKEWKASLRNRDNEIIRRALS